MVQKVLTNFHHNKRIADSGTEEIGKWLDKDLNMRFRW